MTIVAHQTPLLQTILRQATPLLHDHLKQDQILTPLTILRRSNSSTPWTILRQITKSCLHDHLKADSKLLYSMTILKADQTPLLHDHLADQKKSSLHDPFKAVKLLYSRDHLGPQNASTSMTIFFFFFWF